MRVAIIIPWRDSGNKDRRRNFEYVYNYYKEQFDLVYVSSDNSDDHFNRSRAYNIGYKQALEGPAFDCVLWNEADTIIPYESIQKAVTLATDKPGMVIPFTERHELSLRDTLSIIEKGHPPFIFGGQVVHGGGFNTGQASITSNATIQAIGGYWDESFAGWGYDDNAMYEIFKRLAGEPRWVHGPGMHLYHEPAYTVHTPESREQTQKNEDRYNVILKMTDEELSNYVGTFRS